MKYLCGNWKMYLDTAESLRLAEALQTVSYDVERVTSVVFPTTLSLLDVQRRLVGTSVVVGAQNCAWVPKGAYTGAISALLLKEAGCTYVLLGHSERRHIFGETDVTIRKKIDACLDVGLLPVVCIGETQEDLDNGKREYRLRKQLLSAFEHLTVADNGIMVAYEPVWSIGTGKPCLPADVDDIHGWIRQEIGHYVPSRVPILYGGSVAPETVLSYVSRDPVDGVLVGKASVHVESWTALLRAVAASTQSSV